MVQARHVNKLLMSIRQFTEQVPEYVDVLYAMVRVAEMPMRRNQALVMKQLMRAFAYIADDFSQDRDARYRLTTSAEQHFKRNCFGTAQPDSLFFLLNT